MLSYLKSASTGRWLRRWSWAAVAVLGLTAYIVGSSVDLTPTLPELSRWGDRSEGHVAVLAYSPNGEMVASGGRWLTLRDLRRGESRRMRPPPDPGVSQDVVQETSAGPDQVPALTLALAFSPDGRWLASGDQLGTVRVWDVARGTLVDEQSGPHARRVLAVAFSPDGRSLASGGEDREVCLWDLHPLTLRRALTIPGREPPWNLPRPVGFVVGFQEDGTTLVSSQARTGTRIDLWDVHSGGVRSASEGPVNTWPYALSRDGRVLLTGDAETAVLRDANTSQVRTVLAKPHERSWVTTGSSFAPNGRRVAVSWVSPTRTWMDPLGQTEREVLAGLGLVSGWGGDVRVHDVATGRMLARLPRQVCAAFGPSGERLATSDGQGQVHLWDLRP